MNWIWRGLKTNNKEKLAIKQPNPHKCILSPNKDKYQFWAMFLAKETIDYDGLFLNLSSMPERIRFAVYLKILGRKPYNNRISKTKNDSEIVKEIFTCCEKNPINQEKCIFNIYKTLEADFKEHLVFNCQKLIRLIHFFLKMECAFEEGVYSILFELIKNRGLSEGLKTEIQNSIQLESNIENKLEKTSNFDSSRTENFLLKKIWNVIFLRNFDDLIAITDSIICIRDVSFNQIFYKAIQMSHLTDPEDIIKMLVYPLNKEFYRLDYKKKRELEISKEAANYNKLNESYYDFLIVQNKMIETQMNMQQTFNRKVQDYENQNEKLKTENTILKCKLQNIERMFDEHDRV